jgi:hypothetical protein
MLRGMSTRALSAVALFGLLSCDPFAGGASNASGTGSGGGGGGLLGGLSGLACPELSGGGSALGAKFTGKASLNVKIGAFVQAAKDLGSLSARMDAEITGACRRMGDDLKVPATEMQPREGVAASTAACGAVSAKIKAALKGSVQLKASFTPPKCEVNAAASASCDGRCTVEVEPAEIVAKCTPAKLSGRARGRARGSATGRARGRARANARPRTRRGGARGSARGRARGRAARRATRRARASGRRRSARGR